MVQRLYQRVEHRISRAIEFARSLSENRVISDDCATVQIGILIRGGIGDAMIAARWLHGIIATIRSGGEVAIDVYYALPDNIAFIFGNLPCIRYIYHDITFEYVNRYYELALVINHLGFLELKSARPSHLSRHAVLSEMLAKWSPGIRDFKRFTSKDYHPKLGAGFAHYIQAHSLTRQDILRAQTALPAPVAPFTFRFAEDDRLPEHPVLDAPFVTVHDGWDWQLRLETRRPTKSYPPKKWASLVSAIRDRFPDVGIVQIGGEAGSDIPGVDLNLRNAISLPVAARVLQKAVLHIDTDSGLVHLAASLGTRAVVLFGPTDIAYYGYPGNVNVNAQGCNSCWLSSGSWITTCLLGDTVPRCMDSIEPEHVVLAIEHAISPRQSG